MDSGGQWSRMTDEQDANGSSQASRDEATTEAMRAIDRDYRAASGLQERRHYKIFYSSIHPFPLLVLGQNPGGETDGTDLVASPTFFENWEHDFVHFRHCPAYSLARPMCDLLVQALETQSVDALRQVPVSNVIFRRSRKTKSLNVSLTVAASEAQPFVSRLIKAVNPRCVLLISKTAYDLFARHHCQARSVTEDESPKIYTPNGRNPACIFLRARGFVHALDRETPLLMVGHPSKFSSRQEWRSATSALRSALQQLGISPVENFPVLVKLPPFPTYGTKL